jgi:hypothetical protein
LAVEYGRPLRRWSQNKNGVSKSWMMRQRISHERALLEFTPEAVQEIERRRTGGRFENDIAVRLLPDDRDRRTCLLQFDYPVSDGNQWLFRSEGLTVVIDKTDTDFFDRQNIHFDGYEFLVFETKS